MPVPGNGVYVNTITRGGKTIRYLRISSGPQRGQYVHQLVAAAKLGRDLMPFEEVDHDDGNTLNNHFSNLVVRHSRVHARITRSRHARQTR